jgi:biopolymer transport protein TolR
MALRRLRHKKTNMIINNIDMTSLIDLTFLLLITFIITMPALEQGISIRLPHGKTDSLPSKKANIITLDAQGKIFLNNRTISVDDLEKTLGNLAADDAETAVLVRADERLDYGKVMSVVKLLYKVKITKLALVTLAE